MIKKLLLLLILTHALFASTIQETEQAIRSAPTLAERFILTSKLADLQVKAFNKNRYKRSKFQNQEHLKKIKQLYLQSLDPIAKTIKLSDHPELLSFSKAENNYIEGLRPTLYDLLAHRLLRYFSRYHYGLVNHYKSSLEIYDKLIELHREDHKNNALAHVEIEKLNYIHKKEIQGARDKSYLKRKNSDYCSELEAIEERRGNGEALFELAKFYNSKNSKEKAMDYAKRALASPSTYIKLTSQNLIHEIKSEALALDIESVTLPHENILAKVNYRNIEEMHLKVIPVDDAIIEKIDALQKKEDRSAYIDQLPILKRLDFKLPQYQERYQSHSTELSLDGYEIGRYLLVISASQDFTRKKIYRLITISNLSYLVNRAENRLLLLHRKEGKPLPNIKATLYIQSYDEEREESIERPLELISDQEGYIELPTGDESVSLRLSRGQDILDMRAGNLFYLNSEEDQKEDEKLTRQNSAVLFFTDRAIYRPLQTIHFKGVIARKFKEKAPRVISNRAVMVYFYNANHKKIAEKELITDEFGSFFGSFNTPATGKLGVFELRTDIGGSKKIRVEEYKRPKFSVHFEPLDRSYQLGDTITLTGVAKSYMGKLLKGAKVRYSVSRTTPYKSLSSGVGKTDKNGRFSISFRAIKEMKKKENYYTYLIKAEITDLTGETQQAQKRLELGDHDFKIALRGEKIFFKNSDQTIAIESLGMDGKFKALEAKLTIEKNRREQKLYRKRYWWEAVDSPFYTKEAFEQRFPDYKYQKKENKKRELIDAHALDTDSQREISLKGLEQGVYLISLTIEDLTIRKEITIQDPTKKEPPMVTALWHYTDKKQYHKGEQVELTLQSSLPPSSPLLLSVTQDDKLIYKKWISTDQTKALIDLTQAHQGRLFYHIMAVQNNRFYQYKGEINLPWEDKLNIELISFREKLKPHTKEQISLRVSSSDNTHPRTQMVASIYDASLDAFVNHQFKMDSLYPTQKYGYSNWQALIFGYDSIYGEWREKGSKIYQEFPFLKGEKHYFNSEYDEEYPDNPIEPIMNITNRDRLKNLSGGGKGGDIGGITFFEAPVAISTAPIRKDLNETILFQPNIESNEQGEMTIDFETNGALTRWNFLAFAHTKDLKTAVIKKSFITQKKLMVVTNLPRFFRKGDKITIREKIVNISDEDIHGEYEMKLLNPTTHQPLFEQTFKKPFNIEKNSSTTIGFEFTLPKEANLSALEHTFSAKTATHTDAEQTLVPILSHRRLITKSKLLRIKGDESRDFTFEALQNNRSTSLKNHKLTLEFNSNPAWYAIRSLPYLMEYEKECSEQLFARFSANALASHLIKQQPKLRDIFASWRDRGELQSALTTNPKLKSILLEETPWVLEAKNQEEQLKRLGLLFDIESMAKEQKKALEKLAKRQFSNGAFSWFGGRYFDRYMTQYIVEGMGHLEQRGIEIKNQKMIRRAITFLDKEIAKSYKKHQPLNAIIIHYLYARSFFAHYPITANAENGHNHYLKKAQEQWRGQPLYEQALIAMALYQNGKDALPIVKALKDQATTDEELGIYFEYNDGYHWNQLPIETHALMIEVFREIAKDKVTVKLLKVWLLQHRQSNHWSSTKATTSAIYALLDEGELENSNEAVTVQFKNGISSTDIERDETGHFQMAFNEFNRSMANFQVNNPNPNMAYGAVYWHYFEEITKIKKDKKSPIKISKKLYKELPNKKLIPVTKKTPLKVGEKIKIRIEITLDRAMEYLMLKDSRASTFEPIDLLSGYHYKKAFNYYRSTKDSATYFFFDRLRRGRYLLEYDVYVTHRGKFVDGIATIESMYAPEFRGASVGRVIGVE